MAVRAVEHGHQRLRIFIEGDESFVQTTRGVAVDGIAHLRSLQRDHGHGAEFLHLHAAGRVHGGITPHGGAGPVRDMGWGQPCES